MPLTITDFIEQVDGVSTKDIPFDERKRINDKLSDLTGGPGGGGAPVNTNAILVSKNLDGRNGFSSIQAAVDTASSGNTIFVEPGTYNEGVVIEEDIDTLTLEGPNAGIAGDSDARGDEATIVGGVFMDSTSDIIVDGFELERKVGREGEDGLTPEGVFQMGATSGGPGDPDGPLAVENVTIKNNIVTAVPNQNEFMGAIYIEDVDKINVNNNLLTQADSTDSLSGGTGNPVRALLQARGDIDLTYDENRVETGYGILLDGNNKGGDTYKIDATITNNEFIENLFGVYAVGSGASGKVKNNEFKGTDGTNAYVANLSGASLDLNAILKNKNNTFDPEGTIDENAIITQKTR